MSPRKRADQKQRDKEAADRFMTTFQFQQSITGLITMDRSEGSGAPERGGDLSPQEALARQGIENACDDLMGRQSSSDSGAAEKAGTDTKADGITKLTGTILQPNREKKGAISRFTGVKTEEGTDDNELEHLLVGRGRRSASAPQQGQNVPFLMREFQAKVLKKANSGMASKPNSARDLPTSTRTVSYSPLARLFVEAPNNSTPNKDPTGRPSNAGKRKREDGDAPKQTMAPNCRLSIAPREETPLGDDLVTVLVGDSYVEFYVPRPCIAKCPVLESSIQNGDRHPLLIEVSPSDFVPVAEFLETSEYRPRLINAGTDYACLDMVTESDEGYAEEIHRSGRIYHLAGQLQLLDLQALALEKLKTLGSFSGRDILELSCFIYNKIEDDDDKMRLFLAGYVAQNWASLSLEVPEELQQTLRKLGDLSYNVLLGTQELLQTA